jgi:hypothetical protein
MTHSKIELGEKKMRMKLVWLPLVSMLLLIIAPPQVFPVAADKIVGLSPRYQNPIIIEPDSFWSGSLVAFNQGDEDVICYAEVRGAKFPWIFEWEFSLGDWVETLEIPIPVAEHRYGRFNVSIPEDIQQGMFYNWSVVVGYLDDNPDTHAVAAAGSQIHMIYPKPPSMLERLAGFLGANKWLPIGIVVIVIAGVLFRRYYPRLRTFLDQEPWDVRKKREKTS